MAQVMELLLSKCALGELNLEIMILKELKYQWNMLNMILKGVAVDKYIIYEHHYTLPEQGCQNMIHDILECSRSTSKSIGHDFVFKVTIMSLEGSLILVIFMNHNLVKPRFKIQGGKPFGTL